MLCYISKDDVKSSVEYFKTAGFDTEEMLFFFLMSKHLGVSTSIPITYLSGSLSDEERKERRHTLWMLGGLFDSTECCGVRGVMFPTEFSRCRPYNPGTEFKGLDTRVKDTIQKKNLTFPIFNDRDSVLTLKNGYRELVQDNMLKGNKIKLSKLAAWVFRFTSFDFEALPDAKVFTRVIERAIRSYFRITKADYLWLFENDLSVCRLTASNESMTGAEVRELFDFEDGKQPAVQTPGPEDTIQCYALDEATVQRYIALSGDNPSISDIMDILKVKKQIVLTGVPGVGKSRYTQLLSADPFFAEKKTIQFHSSFAYEDFIGSETLTEGGSIATRKGVFLDYANDARENPDKNYLFVIDELNRGNIAEIFGETILALDRDYEVELSKEYDGVGTIKLPENLYIVATMNTSDRNIAFLDLAIRRRFAFVSLEPNYDFLSEEVTLEDMDLGNILKIINQRILNTLRDPELVLGQSYFIPPKVGEGYSWTKEQFKNQFNFVLLPTIKEYSFNEPGAIAAIVGDRLGDGILEVDEFWSVFKAEFAY